MNTLNKIAVFDIDGTLIRGDIQIGLINYLWASKKITTISVFTICFWFALYKVHLFPNINYIFQLGLKFLKNKSPNEISHYIDEFIQKRLSKLILNDAIRLILEYKKLGYKILLLSSVVEPIVSKLAPFFHADCYVCTKVKINNGLFTGEIDGKIVYGIDKLNELQNFCVHNDIALGDVVAFADHTSDIILLKSVGKGYFVNPKLNVTKLAKQNAIDIIYIKS